MIERWHLIEMAFDASFLIQTRQGQEYHIWQCLSLSFPNKIKQQGMMMRVKALGMYKKSIRTFSVASVALNKNV